MNLNPLFPTCGTLGINTDLYELTMAAAYYQAGHAEDIAAFELYTRELPVSRNFLIAAGLEQALHYVLHAGFTKETVGYLKRLSIFEAVDPGFFDRLLNFRFSGDIWALPEGTVFFANQPVLQVVGPVIEAQILETFLINVINVQTMVASKATRICEAACGKPVVDFGSRRAHGPQTGVLAARAAFIGGCDGTSNVLAGYEMGIPVFGTMAHSFVQFFEKESEAFRSFQKTFPKNTTIVVDTYDSLDGVKKALTLKDDFRAIRLDSGDLAELSAAARRLLDEAGRRNVLILASGNLTEKRLQALAQANAPIDGFGLGTDLVVSADAPTCDLVYKLVEIERGGNSIPKFKTSENKRSLPFRKQVYRVVRDGSFTRDIVGRWDQACEVDNCTVVPLLECVVKKGRLVRDIPSVKEIRERLSQQLSQLPVEYKRLRKRAEYPVEFTSAIAGTASQREIEL